MTAHTGVYVRYEGKDEQQTDQFLVLAVNCAHLGCPVSWFPQSGLFMCPCHGGVYYATGERASGPPPRGLFTCVWQVRDGRARGPGPALSDLAGHAGRVGMTASDGAGGGPMMKHLAEDRVGQWLDARLGFRESILPMLTHPIPRGAAGPMGWWYVFGSASMTLLMIQVAHRHRPGAGVRAGRRPGV